MPNLSQGSIEQNAYERAAQVVDRKAQKMREAAIETDTPILRSVASRLEEVAAEIRTLAGSSNG